MKSVARLFLLLALAGALAIVSTPRTHATEPALHVIPLKHRLADEVVPVVLPLLAPGESVSGMDSRLIVRASSRTFRNRADPARRHELWPHDESKPARYQTYSTVTG